jgi:gas vesicle protein
MLARCYAFLRCFLDLTEVFDMARFSKSQAAGFLLTGAVVGAAVALLYAPKSGAQTRRDIRKFSKRTLDRLDDLQDEMRDQVTDWVEDMSTVVKDGLNAGKQIGVQKYEQVLDVFDSAKKYVEDGKNRLQRMIQTA